MKQIALVSVTLNAANPMTEFLASNPEYSVQNYLDSYILSKVRADGTITDDLVRRMFTMLSHACEDGADGIIVTCTIFSAYIDSFSNVLSVPSVAADVAMMEQAGRVGGNTALLCTFPGTRDISTNLLDRYMKANGKPYAITSFVLEDAYIRANTGDLKGHDQIIMDKIREIDGQFDNIVIAQMSMAQAATQVTDAKSEIFTSPKSALDALLTQL